MAGKPLGTACSGPDRQGPSTRECAVGRLLVVGVGQLHLPGPDTVMIPRSSVGGRFVAMAAAAGALCSLTVHILVGAVGLSAVIVAHPGSLTVLAILGAAYLAYLGIRALTESGRTRRRGGRPLTVGTEPVSGSHARRRAFRSTFVTNLTNPTVILFFVAVLPQFVDRTSSWPVAMQLGVLGAADVLVGVLYLPTLVLFGVRAFRNLGPRGLANLELEVGVQS
ncbi:MAG: LysE family translocator [Rhodococcus sp. (in: high G+C Gram-positive bacteria)]